MPIPNPNPITLDPVPAKTFPHVWLTAIEISAPSTTSGSATITTVPYNGDSGELASGAYSDKIRTSELWLAVQEVPEVAAAMQSLIDAVEPLREWLAAKEAAAETPEP